MLNMVQCLALSLRRFGGSYRDAPIILTVGDDKVDTSLEDRHPWLSRLGIEARWVPEEAFRSHSYFATGAARFDHDYRSDVVLFLDADVLVAAPFDKLIRDVHRRQNFAGVIALASPMLHVASPTTWAELYVHCGIDREPDLRHEYSGWPYFDTCAPEHRYGPAYFNYGVVCAPAEMMTRIGSRYFGHYLKLRERIDTILVSQIALTAALVDLQLPYRTLPMRYNFSNVLAVEALHAAELPRARFLHLLAKLQLDKSLLYTDIGQIRATIARDDLRGVSARVRQILKAIEPDWTEESVPLSSPHQL